MQRCTEPLDLAGIAPVEWVLIETKDSMRPITIRQMPQISGPDKYAVYMGKDLCLNRKGEWEWEPLPSSRTEAHLRKCRYDTLEEAYGKLVSMLRRKDEGNNQRSTSPNEGSKRQAG